MGSREHVESFSSVIIFPTASASARLKHSKLTSLCSSKCSAVILLSDTSSNEDYCLLKVARTLFTLKIWVFEVLQLAVGLTKESIVLKSSLGLWMLVLIRFEKYACHDVRIALL